MLLLQTYVHGSWWYACTPILQPHPLLFSLLVSFLTLSHGSSAKQHKPMWKPIHIHQRTLSIVNQLGFIMRILPRVFSRYVQAYLSSPPCSQQASASVRGRRREPSSTSFSLSLASFRRRLWAPHAPQKTPPSNLVQTIKKHRFAATLARCFPPALNSSIGPMKSVLAQTDAPFRGAQQPPSSNGRDVNHAVSTLPCMRRFLACVAS